jgi:hypothetical protein
MMAEIYFAVFMREFEAPPPASNLFEKATILGGPQDARIVKLEAENVSEAQRTVEHFYPGEMVTIPVIVTEAQFKES